MLQSSKNLFFQAHSGKWHIERGKCSLLFSLAPLMLVNERGPLYGNQKSNLACRTFWIISFEIIDWYTY